MRCQNVRPNREWCAMTFISDRGYDNRTGAKNRPKIHIDNAWGKLCRVVAQSENFVETYESPHLKRLSSCARTYHAMGYKLYPWGARAPQICPIDFQWCRTAHFMFFFPHHRNRFSIEHNSGSQCHRDKGAGSFDSDDQSASQDHCEAIKPRP